MWNKFKHDNILPCLGILEAVGSIFLVSPYMKNGSLAQYIRTDPNRDRMEWVDFVLLCSLLRLMSPGGK